MYKSFSIVLSVLALVSTGCGGKSSPTDPTPASITSASSCAAGCDNTLHIPDPGVVRQQMDSARDAIRDAIANGSLKAKKRADWNVVPTVEWKACFFLVDNVSWVENGITRTGSNCAAGLTDYEGKRIVIATNDPSRTPALVRWETANFYLIAIGRRDLADSWQATH
ncbi:MAG TPA: hypothetical protein VHL58_09850 [Thermoanaerobaculia bacterium]|nr:hypothetical protein [Thermoanaerobaculia bacterium]